MNFERRTPGDIMSVLELKVPPLAVAAILSAIMWLGAGLAPLHAFSLPGQRLVAVALATAGALIGMAGVVAFRQSKTTVDPRQPSASSALVTTGVYRLTRNPMYVGVLMGLAAWATDLGNLLAFAALPVFVLYMNRFQIAPEERALRTRFGSGYTDYERCVRRWL